jgi:hypothetical protein
VAENREQGKEKAGGQRDLRLPPGLRGSWRRRMGLKDELLLALFPTATVLVTAILVGLQRTVLWLVRRRRSR